MEYKDSVNLYNRKQNKLKMANSGNPSDETIKGHSHYNNTVLMDKPQLINYIDCKAAPEFENKINLNNLEFENIPLKI